MSSGNEYMERRHEKSAYGVVRVENVENLSLGAANFTSACSCRVNDTDYYSTAEDLYSWCPDDQAPAYSIVMSGDAARRASSPVHPMPLPSMMKAGNGDSEEGPPEYSVVDSMKPSASHDTAPRQLATRLTGLPSLVSSKLVATIRRQGRRVIDVTSAVVARPSVRLRGSKKPTESRSPYG